MILIFYELFLVLNNLIYSISHPASFIFEFLTIEYTSLKIISVLTSIYSYWSTLSTQNIYLHIAFWNFNVSAHLYSSHSGRLFWLLVWFINFAYKAWVYLKVVGVGAVELEAKWKSMVQQYYSYVMNQIETVLLWLTQVNISP